MLSTLCVRSVLKRVGKKLQIDTIRLRLFKVAGKLVNTARRIYMKLSSSHVYQTEFYDVFHRIQRIRYYI